MKKFLLPILIMAMVSLASCGGDDNDTPTPPEQKSLKLTKIITKTKSFSGKDKDEEKKEDVMVFTYGANGYVSKITGVDGDFSYTEFIYNDKNQLVEQKSVERDSEGNEESVDVNFYTYNNLGLLVLEKDDEGFEYTYEYNSENLMIKSVGYYENKKQDTEFYEYDVEGNVINYSRRNYAASYTFDDKKNPWATAFPKEFSVISPVYLGQHNLLSEKDGTDKFVYTYTYTYNDEGYPIKQEEKYYSSGGQLSEIETTEFFYK